MKPNSAILCRRKFERFLARSKPRFAAPVSHQNSVPHHTADYVDIQYCCPDYSNTPTNKLVLFDVAAVTFLNFETKADSCLENVKEHV